MSAVAPTTLAELASELPLDHGSTLRGDADATVTGIDLDSRRVGVGDAFVCIDGGTEDGHAYAADAVERGAAALVVARFLPLEVPQLRVADPRRSIGPLASALHGHPSRSMSVIGITGTNGKTTTAHLLGAILRGAGHDVRVHGTLSGTRTTPEAPDLQARLAAARDEGVDTVVMEVSSHALALHRVDGTRFRIAVFTNLGHDHLDLHGTIEAYFRAKARLFEPDLAAAAVVDVDDTHGRLLADTIAIPVHRYQLADATDVVTALDRQTFTWLGHHVEVPLGGRVNRSNALAALTAAVAIGVDPAVAARSIGNADTVPGRFEVVVSPPAAPFTVMVDYAHTPDGLETLLAAVRGAVDGGRVLVVFGCGGERDRDKRPRMGAVAADGADVVIVTSDNPRREEPSAITDAIVSAMSDEQRRRTTVEIDRRTAIGHAVDQARPGDVVVIAGKGHETTQTIGTTDHPFDDRVEARAAFDRRGSR